jgi:hypothetical protein
MAVMGNIAWSDSNFRPASSSKVCASSSSRTVQTAHKIAEILDFSRVFRGHELTRKDDRIPCGLPSVDNLIEGGIIRGRISEIIAEPGAGKASLAAAFAASVTRCEAAAWIDNSDDFDPASIAAAGVELTRLLWVSSSRAKGAPAWTHAPLAGMAAPWAEAPALPSVSKFSGVAASLKAAEWILAVGGFGLVILDFGANASQLSQSAALRLARAAERSGAGVLILAARRVCGTFAVLSLTLRRERACFSRLGPGAPALFDGLVLKAYVTRNKLGRSGQTAKWETVTEALGGAQCSRVHQQNEVERGNESARCACKKESATVFNKCGSRTAPTKYLTSQAKAP